LGDSLPKKMVVAVEGVEPSLKESSMKAVRYALILAAASSAELVAICVVQVPEYIEESVRSKLSDELTSKSEATLAEVGRLADSARVRYTSRVLTTSGAISTAICDLSEDLGADLIVLGTRANTSSLTKMMLGSVASGVVGNANCPVLVVR
jgi:nucleotide-binding universal stress UspA family protein